MSINKVIYNGNSLIDLTEDTVTPETLAEGVTAHDKSGAVIIGTMRSGEDLEAVLTEQAELIDTLQETLRHKVSGGGGGVAVEGIPSGYTKVDYIQFNEEQIVDTGIICDQDTKIRVVFTRESTTSKYMYGVTVDGNASAVTAYLGGAWRFGAKSVSMSAFVHANNEIIYTAIVDKTQIHVSNADKSISGVSNFETVGTLVLGACRLNGNIQGAAFVGKIFQFEIWKDGEKVLKLSPVVDADGNYHFWDAIGKKLHDSITDTPLDGGNL